MAYRYNENSGEFVDSPESKKTPLASTYGETAPTRRKRSVAWRCMNAIGEFLLYCLIMAVLMAICSLFDR